MQSAFSGEGKGREEDSSDQDDLSQADVARKFGVTRGVVSQWLEAYKKAGNSIEGLEFLRNYLVKYIKL
jgi:transcriptional regulator with XRE-family HTH domain